MASKGDITRAIEAVDQRLDTLRDRILASGDVPLAEGTWRVRDVLSHLAARANGVARVVARAEAADRPAPDAPPPPRNVDEINAGQVEERRDRTVEQLMDEIAAGHRAAVEAVATLDQALLDRMLPLGFRPGESSVGDMIVRGGPGHDQNHLDQVEAVLPS